MPRVRKPNSTKEEETELTSNPIPVEELKKMRKKIIASNEIVSTSEKFGRVDPSMPFRSTFAQTSSKKNRIFL